MGTANSLLIISDNREEVLELRSKLTLLRDVDSIIGAKTEDTLNACKEYVPDTVLICVKEHNQKYFEACQTIRQDLLLKNTPIIFILDSFDEEIILSGFDAGINDYICKSFHDSELVMRIIWCLQKSETARELEKKQKILSNLGVIDTETKIYAPEYISTVFSNEINFAQKYKTSLVLMAISVDNNYKGQVTDNVLVDVINKSTRKADILGLAESGKIYVLLPKTKIDGVKTIFERINSKADFSISAGVCQFNSDMDYEKLSFSAANMLSRALERGNSIIMTESSLVK